MSARLYDPAEHSEAADAITMTPAAQRHVRRQLAKERSQALLLGVSESGCNGFKYDLSFIDSHDGDSTATRRFEFDDVTVFVLNANWPLVRGTEIDYVTEGLNSALAFKNPNATAECGCGESFSVR